MTKTVAAGHTLTFGGVLQAGQTVTVQSGTAGDPQGGVILVTAHATNLGTIDLLAGPRRNGVYVTPATLLVSGALTNDGAINLQGGAYGLGSAGQVSGSVLQDQGSVVNAGSIYLGAAAAGTDRHAQPTTGAALDDHGVLTNRGQISMGGSNGRQGYSGSLVVFGTLSADAGTLLAQAATNGGNGGKLEVYRGGYLQNGALIDLAGGYSGAGGVLVDNGLLKNTGSITINGPDNGAAYKTGATLDVSTLGTLINAGVLINAGSLTLDGSYGVYRGPLPAAYMASSANLLNKGLLTVQGGFGRPTEGSLGAYLGTGANLTNSGLLDNPGHLVVDACNGPGTAGVLTDRGTLNNSGTVTLYGGVVEYQSRPKGATLSVIGTLANSGLVTIDGGVIAGGYSTPGYCGVLTDSGLLTNTGTIGVAGGQLIDSLTLTNSGVITVDAVVSGYASKSLVGLSVSVAGTLINSGTIGGAGELMNQGQILAANGSDLTVASLVNGGTIDVLSSNAMFISSAITGTGTGGALALQYQATLTLAGSVAKDQQVEFASGGGILALGDASQFAGVLAGLGAGSVIDFLSLDVISAMASGTTLAIGEANGSTLDLKLAAPLPAGTGLDLISDQNGGTDLLVQPPANA